MFDSDTQGFYKSEQQESSIMRRSFNPHALQRSAPLLHVGAVYHHEFQSTRPMRGATTLDDLRGSGSLVSIPAPHAGRDPRISRSGISRRQFQSTRPMRGATTQALNTHRGLVVSIHAPRVGRDTPPLTGVSSFPSFNPRAPCGARHLRDFDLDNIIQFQSTRPVWGATPLTDVSHTSSCFNPRAPCGARLAANVPQRACPTFQSPRPVWGATRCRSTPEQGSRVSIHAPRVGRDMF